MLVCLLLGAAGTAADASIVAEQARTIGALKAVADISAENAELKAEVATLKGAGSGGGSPVNSRSPPRRSRPAQPRKAA